MPVELDPAVMERVARAVLEEAAFLFSDEAPEGLVFDSPLIEASIDFQGPVAGVLTLRVPEAVAVEAAANLLGLEPEDGEAVEGADSAVGELLNMISGSLMKEWFGAQVQCALGLPRVERREAAPTPRGGCEAHFLVGETARVEIAATVTGA